MTDNIQNEVSKRVSGAVVKDKVIDYYADAEIERLTKIIIKLVDEADRYKRVVANTKPDHEIYDNDGNVINIGWSKGKLDAFNDNKKYLSKLRKAINKALEKGDFSDAEEIAKKL